MDCLGYLKWRKMRMRRLAADWVRSLRNARDKETAVVFWKLLAVEVESFAVWAGSLGRFELTSQWGD